MSNCQIHKARYQQAHLCITIVTRFSLEEQKLLQLAKILKESVSEENGVLHVGIVVASTGAGGLGKTQLATEFVYRYGQYFDGGVFWLNFADEKSIPFQVAACGGPRALDLRPNFASFSLGEQIERVQAAWSEALPRLLIFDNCDNKALFHQWRPRHGGCRILITSRRGQWSRGFRVGAPIPTPWYKKARKSKSTPANLSNVVDQFRGLQECFCHNLFPSYGRNYLRTLGILFIVRRQRVQMLTMRGDPLISMRRR